jgi:hypothetical protein
MSQPEFHRQLCLEMIKQDDAVILESTESKLLMVKVIGTAHAPDQYLTLEQYWEQRYDLEPLPAPYPMPSIVFRGLDTTLAEDQMQIEINKRHTIPYYTKDRAHEMAATDTEVDCVAFETEDNVRVTYKGSNSFMGLQEYWYRKHAPRFNKDEFNYWCEHGRVPPVWYNSRD